ncbi:DNA replication/repair protein RecF [Wenzhouxiangella sp. XN24]|uniref:DNA replication/repair protein RecF n=1 Tax=Wenzhouxiangella sp. XN24 TaxID=2713569 RepID=UPI0013ED9749|nr:DNA replication/repair protein RecF [Wenzhouxiangella sp. XN24]NGX17519.1 DNA replication/repair protein RecF [Wenzhouxiangella sp. XN24]
MGLKRLSISGFRCFDRADLEPSAGVNVVVGPNASGKTSLLEAMFLLGRGRSFRAARKQAMIRETAAELQVVGRLGDGRSVGIEVSKDGWTARAAGEPVTQLAELASLLPIQVMDPEIHRLVQEGPGERRRYIDWATFHVEHEFLETWRKYQRALRQRNAALRSRQPDSMIQPWEQALGESGTALDRYRAEAVAQLAAPVNAAAERLLGTPLGLEYRPGQPLGTTLSSALAEHRERDRKAGTTQIGPHRAELSLLLDGHKARGWVSRGQQKLVAAALVLGQAQLLAPYWDDRGVLLVDDPAAELDADRCERLLTLIGEMPFQVFVTSLDPGSLPGLTPEAVFHVEQGEVVRVV